MTGLQAWLIIFAFLAIAFLIGCGLDKLIEPFVIKWKIKDAKERMKADIRMDQALNTLFGEAYSEVLDEDAKSAAKRMREGKY